MLTKGQKTRYPPVCLTTQGLSYKVLKNKAYLNNICINKKAYSYSNILNDVNLCVRSGEIMAIMGPSGAGKTTLLNCLSGRIFRGRRQRGLLQGQVFLNGESQSSNSMRKRSSYVLQKDCLLDCLTVEETLHLAASFIMKNVSVVERKRRVEEVISELKLHKCRYNYIGGDLVKGISGGEMKRTCIGIALLEDPSLLFLDEPTSGLDSSLAFDVLKLLGKLAEGGRTIVCTVHQPGSHMFSMFNQLLLLSEGHVVYQGPPLQVCGYFSKLGYPCPQHFNPADFVLDLLVPKHSDTSNFFADIQNKSSENNKDFYTKVSLKPDFNDIIGKSECRTDLFEATRNNIDIEMNCEIEIHKDVFSMKEDEEDEYMNDESQPCINEKTAKKALILCTTPKSPSCCSHEVSIDLSNRYRDGLSCTTTHSGTFEKYRLQLSQEALEKLPIYYQQSEEFATIQHYIDEHSCINGVITSPTQSDAFDNKCLQLNNKSVGSRMHDSINQILSPVFRWLYDVQLITWRSSVNSMRHPIVGWASFLVHLVLAIALGAIWFQLRGSEDKPKNVGSLIFSGGMKKITDSAKHMASDFRNTCGALFFAVIFFGFSAFAALMPFQQERVVFNRETASGMYSASSFFVGKNLADIPFQHIPATVFLIIFYWMVGFGASASQFFSFVLVGNLTVFAACGMFYALGALVNNMHVAHLLAPICLVSCMLVAGFFINVIDLPLWISWMQHVSFLKHAFAALTTNQFPPEENYGFLKNTQWLEALGVVEYRVHFSTWMLFVLGIGYRFIAFFFLKYTNRRVGLEA